MACVEIKTRTNENIIVTAKEELTNHGCVVYCSHKDIIFQDCVPSVNREKILYQAAISNYNIGIFVIAKVEDEERIIVQILNNAISYTTRLDHREWLVPVAYQLLGWLYEEEVIARGYLF